MRKILVIIGLFISLGLQAQTILTNAHIRATSTGIGWDDVIVSFETGQNAGTAYPVFNADSCSYNFVTDTTGVSKCMMYFVVEIPHAWQDGSAAIHPHVHYKHTAAQGTPTFVLKYKWFNILSKAPTTWSRITLGTNVVGVPTDYQHGIVEDAADAGIIGTGKTLSSILICQLFLLTTSGGVKTCDAYQMGIHLGLDDLGSRTEYVK